MVIHGQNGSSHQVVFEQERVEDRGMSKTMAKSGLQSILDVRAPNEPIVLSFQQKKRRKRRYSKGLGEIQQIDRHLTRASHRMAQAVEVGVSDYRKSTIKSARKKRDGALRDFIPNSGLAMGRALGKASPIPYDLARAMNTKRSRRRLKRQLGMLSRTVRVLR